MPPRLAEVDVEIEKQNQNPLARGKSKHIYAIR